MDHKYCMPSLFLIICSVQKAILVKFHEIGPFVIKYHFGVHCVVQSEKMYNAPLNIFSIHIVEDSYMIFNGYSCKFVDLTTVETPKPGYIL